jgi:hypothetical protein
MTTLIEIVLEKTNKLKSLLEDPHPGLITWNDAVAKALMSLVKHAPRNPKCRCSDE